MFKRKSNVIPGFGLSMGITFTMVSLIVLIPLMSIFVILSQSTLAEFWRVVTDPQTVSTYKVTLQSAIIAALVNVLFGIILAWILTRYQFPFRRLIDGLIELPFALPTMVGGIALTVLYSEHGWIGRIFANWGIEIAYTPIGIVIAMVFVGIPFTVRTIQPVLEKLDPQYEEAAAVLGASRFKIFFKVILPEIMPAALTGFGLALARSIGEYGSVVFIAGNIPFNTQVTTVMIMIRLEQFNYAAATSIALVMVIFAFLLLLGVNLLQVKFNRMGAS